MASNVWLIPHAQPLLRHDLPGIHNRATMYALQVSELLVVFWRHVTGTTFVPIERRRQIQVLFDLALKWKAFAGFFNAARCADLLHST
jgi:hypothetical protein